jgi:hypothetical protein
MNLPQSARCRMTIFAGMLIAGSMAGLLAGLTAEGAAAEEPTTAGPEQAAPHAAAAAPSEKELDDWQAKIVRVPAPKNGCFKASYPSTEWQEVPCAKAPDRLYPPPRPKGT